MFTQDHVSVTEAMRDVERIEAAHMRIRLSTKMKIKTEKVGSEERADTMEIENIQLKKLTPTGARRAFKKDTVCVAVKNVTCRASS